MRVSVLEFWPSNAVLTTAWVANQCEASALGLLRPRLDGIERMRLIGDDIAFRVEELLDRLRSS
jgi:hypothetical protein